MSMKDLILSMMLEHLEEKTNPYAIGMAAAMKAAGDEPPLEKSTIKKAHKIAKGIEKNEEVELDELNKKTLGSYVKKSADDLTHIQRDIGDTSNMKSPEYKKLSKMRSNRKTGINRAVDRLTKEEVELDEISQEKLGSYYDAAAKDRKKAKAEVEKGMAQKKFTPASVQKTADAYKRFIKRGKGMTAAANKMDEESEIVETYAIKHKETGFILNRHSDLESAKDEHSGLGKDKDEYKIVKTKSKAKDWSMKE